MQDLIDQVLNRLPRYTSCKENPFEGKVKAPMSARESDSSEDKCVICLERCRSAGQLLSAASILDKQEIGVLMNCGQQCG